ncbi:MAG: hypothetical protein CMG57_02710 [Candidatus Marinimicrobia bacterium]|nr:hypothetical protein [Candidatus Neomarinimicrobiota bacterium]
MSSLPWVLILDFDSTIVSIESLDLLAEISLMDDPEKEKKLKKVISLTKAGMAGEITFQDSLNKRFSLLNIHQSDVDRVCSIIQNYISSSFIKYSAWMKKNANQIFIFSGGFKQIITQALKPFNILEDHIFANEFLFDESGNILGVDRSIPFSRSNGKLEQAKQMKLSMPLVVVGDGNTDAEMKNLGSQVSFLAYIENIKRDSVVKEADAVAESFDDVIHFLDKME